MALENYGSYQLIKRLATGGMAQIYLARQKGPEGFEKLLVVKRILPHLAENDDFVRMFLDEARIAARLNHPNIVQIFNLGALDESFFIAMEYIHGEDVRRVWKHAEALGKVMPIQLVCRVIMDACSGLDYAHKKTDQNGKPLGIVHRDISPQNILVSFEGGVKVVDFGIAKAADQATVTKSGVLKGKYSYMSPEQAGGKKVDCRSDIFALGVVLHELLTGQRLFKRSNEIQTLHAVTECEVDPPSKSNPRVPRELDALVMKALTRRPEDRFQEAVHLQIALEQWLLERQLPSSSAHLAAFMNELYADRLAEEQRAGHLMVEEPEPGSSQRVADDDILPPTPSRPLRPSHDGRLPSPRQRFSERGAPLPQVVQPPEPTSSQERMTPSVPSFSKSVPQHDGIFEELIKNASSLQGIDPKSVTLGAPMTEPGMTSDGQATISLDSMHAAGTRATHTTEADASRSTLPPSLRARRASLMPLLLSAVALAVVGAGSYMLATRRPQEMTVATVRLRSEPAGAQVELNGKPIAERTPCTLPPAAAGSYTLSLREDGYADTRIQIAIPERGEVILPVVVLTPLRGTGDAGVGGSGLVELTLKSEPAANLWVNGTPKGKTPQIITVAAGSVPEIRLERSGYLPVEREVQVGDVSREEVVILEPGGRSAKPERVDRRNGKVRFAVTPWANVSCGALDLGQTPLPDRELPTGTYECTFTNPDFPPEKREVVVKANDRITVSVKFQSPP